MCWRCFGRAHLAQAQAAISGNLPDQFQARELSSPSKSKKKRVEPTSQTLATAAKRNTPPAPEQTPAVEELPPVLTTEEKKLERSCVVIRMSPE
jgi:hypothetical protein